MEVQKEAQVDNTQAAAGAPEVEAKVEKIEASDTPAEYTPNYKFKVQDAEHEIEEWVRPVIKDAETEKKVKELYEKAFGLDEVKSARDKFKSEYEKLKPTYEETSKKLSSLEMGLRQLSDYVNNDDLGSFFKHAGIPEEKALKWAVERAKYLQLPPEQRQQIDRQFSEKEQFYNLKTENELLKSRMQAEAEARLHQEVDLVFSKPDVSAAAQSFDQRAGKPGAFFEEFKRRGDYYYQLAMAGQGQVKGPQQIVDEIMMLAGISNQPNQQVPGQAQANAIPPEKKVIPNINSTSSSPVKKQLNSLEAIRARIKEQDNE